MLSRLLPLLLLVLTRDGVLHRFDGSHDTTTKVAGATAIAVLDGNRVAVLAGGRLTVDGKPLPGRFDDVRGLAGGARLWARTEGAVLQIDARTGKRTTLFEMPRIHRLAADGNDAFEEHDGVINRVDGRWGWNAHGQAVAFAAGDGKMWLAMKSGPLLEIERESGKQRVLPLGDWWGTIALAYADHALYAVTVAGKLWRIDPQKGEKTIVAMDGWQGAIDLSVLR